MNRWSRLRAAASAHNGDASNTSVSLKQSEIEKGSGGAPFPANSGKMSSPSSMSAQQTQISPVRVNLTADGRKVFSDIAVNPDYVMPDDAIRMTEDDARRLVPRYDGMAQHDMLQWHFMVCTVCRPEKPCPEYFEIIAEYAEYEGYAIRGEG